MGLSAVLSLALAACGSWGSTATPAASAPETSAPAASARPAPRSERPGQRRRRAPRRRGAACAESTTPGTVKVSIENFAFSPSAIAAKVGDTVTFTNGDSAGHTATLDDGSCFTPTIASGKSDALTFTAAGTYPFHCAIHPTMKGTITVS